MNISNYTTLTFDCYGTLIDWESGIYEALAPWLERNGAALSRDEALELFGREEAAQQRDTPDMIYSQLLALVIRRMGDQLDLPVGDDEADRFSASVEHWPAFPDSADALAYLKQHYKLVILSNVDHASFAHSNAKLGVEFDAVYTAQDVGSYKPDPRNFGYLLEHLADLGISRGEVLHTAQSLTHDHVPAEDAGLATCWIDRRHDKPGFGATKPPPRQPRIDARFTSMGAMADAHREEKG
jgi:2-haloalkanoic acid dehalogenase type II